LDESRRKSIHNKGFDLYNFAQPASVGEDKVIDYNRMKVGVK